MHKPKHSQGGGEKEKGLIYLKELPWGMTSMINVGVDYATNWL